MKKFLKILRNVVIGIFAFAIIFYLGVRLYFRIPVHSYYAASEKAFKIPDLSGNFIPQGISFDEKTDSFFLTGYTTDSTASPVYIVNKDTKKTVKKVLLSDTDGEAFTCHAGGISVNGAYIYIAGGSDNCLYVYSYDDIANAENGSYVKCLGKFLTGTVGVAFTTINDGKIYIGEFYREQNYPTLDSHKMTTTGGDYNQALTLVYELSTENDSLYGIEKNPSAVISTPDLAQGMAFNDGLLYVSTSYGVVDSNIFCYDLNKADHGKTFNFDGTELPLYELDSLSLQNTTVIAPFSEEIEFVDGLMYTMCEAASNKYVLGKFTSAYWCYATKMNQ